MSSELPRTAVAGVLRLGEQLAPASLPWRTPPARPARPSVSKGCPPSLAVLHQRLHQARLPGWRKMESPSRTPPRVQGLVAVGE